ncbi:MAG: ribosome maturation factor RimM [Spirochaetaceae bacterium]|jgi:16S rRNA processing protein RimM|nr:ribosome maturation factor RimM [Spirochaetaceae bacterium]
MEKLVAGFIRSPFGVNGKVKVESSSGETSHFLELKEIFVRKDGIEKRFALESAEVNGIGCLIMKLDGIDSPEEMKKYSGWEVLVPRENACPLDRDEYYITDLCRCSLVYGKPPVTVGRITGVIEGGAGELLEVALEDDPDQETPSGGRKVFVPFRKEFIGAVDIGRDTIELLHLWILE